MCRASLTAFWTPFVSVPEYFCSAGELKPAEIDKVLDVIAKPEDYKVIYSGAAAASAFFHAPGPRFAPQICRLLPSRADQPLFSDPQILLEQTARLEGGQLPAGPPPTSTTPLP
jgi:hypothetical protein